MMRQLGKNEGNTSSLFDEMCMAGARSLVISSRCLSSCFIDSAAEQCSGKVGHVWARFDFVSEENLPQS